MHLYLQGSLDHYVDVFNDPSADHDLALPNLTLQAFPETFISDKTLPTETKMIFPFILCVQSTSVPFIPKLSFSFGSSLKLRL